MPPSSSSPSRPDFSHELRLKSRDCRAIAGIDEAGRGPLAGPVVASAVILDHNNLPAGIDDSKRLSPARREQLFVEIMRCAVAVSVASLGATAIDGSNIRQATLEAMRRAITALAVRPDYALIDGRDIPPHLPCPAESLIKGDQLSLSIAAASIIAKVTRDRMMCQAGNVFSSYGFDSHAGYGTAAHRLAIEQHGPVAKLHRFSFAPLRTCLRFVVLEDS